MAEFQPPPRRARTALDYLNDEFEHDLAAELHATSKPARPVKQEVPIDAATAERRRKRAEYERKRRARAEEAKKTQMTAEIQRYVDAAKADAIGWSQKQTKYAGPP